MLAVWGNVLTLFNVITAMVGSVLIYDSFFYRRYGGARFWGVMLLWYLLVSLAMFNQLKGVPPTGEAVLNCLMNTLLILLLYRARWDRAFFVAVTAYALCSVPYYWIEWGVMQGLGLEYSEMVWNIPLYSVVFVAKSLVYLLLGVVIRRLHRPLPETDTPARVWVPLAGIFPFMTLIAYYGARTRIGEESEAWQGALAILDVVNVAALILFDRLERSAIDREQLVAAAERARVQDENLQALTQAYAAQRKLTHDFRACLTTLSGLLEQEDLPAARAYLEELKVRQTERVLLVNTHNAAVDAILNQKGYAGQHRGIDLRFTVNDLSALRLPAVDVTLVLGNLLDNALEACTALPPQDRWVEVRVIYHGQGNPPVLSLSVVNPSRPVKVVNGQIPTGKGDALQHGYGLGNVQEILTRYHAESTFFYENGRFVFSADWPDQLR